MTGRQDSLNKAEEVGEVGEVWAWRGVGFYRPREEYIVEDEDLG